MWLQLHFWFEKRRLTEKQRKEFIAYLRELVLWYRPKRKFFLYEYTPHCFLSMEKIKIFENELMVEKPDFVKSVTWQYKDEGVNGELFIDVMNRITDYNLGLKQEKKNAKFFEHLCHCMFNQTYYEQKEEVLFYIKKYKQIVQAARKAKKVMVKKYGS